MQGLLLFILQCFVDELFQFDFLVLSSKYSEFCARYYHLTLISYYNSWLECLVFVFYLSVNKELSRQYYRINTKITNHYILKLKTRTSLFTVLYFVRIVHLWNVIRVVGIFLKKQFKIFDFYRLNNLFVTETVRSYKIISSKKKTSTKYLIFNNKSIGAQTYKLEKT